MERMLEEKSNPLEASSHKDLLSAFLAARQKYPKIVDDIQLANYVRINYLAGSDTTAIAMRSITYYILKTPGILQKVRDELADHDVEYHVSFDVAKSLQYFDAAVHEVMRMHFVTSIALERVVPPEYGPWTMPNGVTVPVGTQLAFTGWTSHFNEDVFEANTHSFKPERWLRGEQEDEDSYKERVGRMHRNDFSWSYGPRACLGKNIALMEIHMAVSTLLGLIDINSPCASLEDCLLKCVNGVC